MMNWFGCVASASDRNWKKTSISIPISYEFVCLSSIQLSGNVNLMKQYMSRALTVCISKTIAQFCCHFAVFCAALSRSYGCGVYNVHRLVLLVHFYFVSFTARCGIPSNCFSFYTHLLRCLLFSFSKRLNGER